MNHTCLRAVVTLRASALRASLQYAGGFCRTGCFKPNKQSEGLAAQDGLAADPSWPSENRRTGLSILDENPEFYGMALVSGLIPRVGNQAMFAVCNASRIPGLLIGRRIYRIAYWLPI